MSQVVEVIGKQFGRWLRADGPHAGFVLSSRVRLARNLVNALFAHKATSDEQGSVVSVVKSAIERSDALGAMAFLDVSRLDPTEKRFLVERYAISKEMTTGTHERAVLINGDQTMTIMINEEDHVRIQSLQSGLQLRTAWQQANTVDTELDKRLVFAFSDTWGYLTACPTNVGTGLRASAMLHLPALIMTRRIASAVQTVSRVGCMVRGLHGEGTDMVGDFFQVSNQATLGQDEDELIANVERVAEELIVQETRARETLLDESERQLQDRVGRALGILKGARILGLEETMSLLSAVRFGICLGLVPGYTLGRINELMIQVQPAHLTVRAGHELEPLEMDSFRADVVQKSLSSR